MPVLTEVIENHCTGLETELEHEHWEARQGAAWTLGEMGPLAKSATSRLIVRLNDSERRVRVAAAEALGAIGPDAGSDAAAALARLAAEDQQPGVQLAAVEALARMGPHLAPWIGSIERLTAKSDPMVCDAAKRVLKNQRLRPK